MPACTHPSTAALFDARDYVTGEPFAVVRCAACGLALTQPVPADPGHHYPAAYYGAEGAPRFPSPVEWLQGLLYGARAARVEGLAGRPGLVLDVGCGRGRLLAAFRARGWEVHGTELSEASALHPRALGIPVHVGDLGTGPWAPASLDAVTMWHVLEHWADPDAALAPLARLLRPGGVAMIGVPNFASPEARLTRGGWFHLDVPRHLVHLGPAELEALLARHGLEVRGWSHLAPEYDLFSAVQSCENGLGLPHNALYGALRARSARLGGAGPAAALAAVLLAVPLALVALPLSALLPALGLGSSVTAFAVKRG